MANPTSYDCHACVASDKTTVKSYYTKNSEPTPGDFRKRWKLPLTNIRGQWYAEKLGIFHHC